jgi:hypothetical protein
MERFIPMIRHLIFALLVCSQICFSRVWAGDNHLVLVASASSPIASLSTASVRRLYLGVPISQSAHTITPLRNIVDSTTQELFLQHVLFMSSDAYDRQIAGRRYRAGGNTVQEYSNLTDLVAALAANPWAVSYMTEDSVLGMPSIKVITKLW